MDDKKKVIERRGKRRSSTIYLYTLFIYFIGDWSLDLVQALKPETEHLSNYFNLVRFHLLGLDSFG